MASSPLPSAAVPEALRSTCQLLDGLMSPVNTTRRNAEAVYATAAGNPQAVVPQLMAVLCHPAASEVHRAFAAVLLRRMFVYTTKLWEKVAPATQAQVKSALLQAVQTDASPMVVRRICHCIAELSATVLSNPGWPELMPCIFGLVQGADRARRASALFLFNKVAEYCGDVIGPFAGKCIPWLTTSLGDESNEVRVEALRATASLLLSNEDAATDHAFRAIWPQMLKVLERTISEDDLAARETLASVIDIAHLKPTFLRGVVDDTVQHMLIIANHPDMDNELRKLALEFMIVLAEKAGSMARRCKLLVEQAVPLALQLMCTLEDDAEWNNQIDTTTVYTKEQYDDELVGAGEHGIDRMARSLGGALVMPVLSSLMMTMLNSDAWQKRRAALVALALVGEGCAEQVWAALPSLLPLILGKLQDPHPRVQYAAVHCIGQYAADFNESMTDDDKNFQDIYGHAVLEKLAAVCSTSRAGLERVRGHAASAIINVCSPRFCVPEVLGDSAFIGKLLAGLVSVLRECRPQEAQYAVSAVGCVAQVLGEGFVPFYGGFMPLAQGILATQNGKEHRQLRANTMEAIALVGIAVGAEKFAKDGVALMDAVLAMQEAGIASDDPQAKYVKQTMCFLSKVLGDAFIPYMPRVFPPLIKAAAAELKIAFEDMDATGGDEGIEGLDTLVVEIRGMGKKRLGMDAVAMDDKANACQLLNEYLGEVPAVAFMPFLDETAAALVSNIRFAFGAGVRMSSLAAMPKIITMALQDPRDATHAARMLQAMTPQLALAINIDNDMEVMCTAAEAVSEVLRLCRESDSAAVHQAMVDMAPTFIPELSKALTTAHGRCKDRHQELAEDVDADEMARAQVAQADEDEQEFLTSIVDAIGWLIKANKETVMPLLQKHVLPVTKVFLTPGLPDMFLAAAVCTLDDVVEHCTSGAGVLPEFLPVLLKAVVHPRNCVRQAAVYGVGVCAEFGGPAFDTAASSFVQPLVQVAQGAIGDPEENNAGLSIDNAVSAIFKLCKFRAAALGSAMTNNLMGAVLQCLPLSNDSMEAQYLHKEIFSLIANGDERIVGASWSKVGQVLTLIATIMAAHASSVNEDEDSPLLAADTLQALPAMLSIVKGRVGNERFASTLQSLPEGVKAMLGHVIA